MFPKLTRSILVSGFGCFFAANSLIYLRDQNQQAQAEQKIIVPEMQNIKIQQEMTQSLKESQNQSTDNNEEDESLQRTKERVEKMMEKNPSARQNLANFLESLMGIEDQYNQRAPQNEEQRREIEEKKEQKINSFIDSYMRDHISARQHMAHALEQMLNIDEEEKNRVNGIQQTEEIKRKREQKVKRSVNDFMEGRSQAKRQMNNVLNQFLNSDQNSEEVNEEAKIFKERRAQIKQNLSSFMQENPSAKKHMLNLLDVILNVETGFRTKDYLTQEQIMRDIEQGRQVLRRRMRSLRIQDGKELNEQEKQRSKQLLNASKSILDMGQLLQKTHDAVEKKLLRMKKEETDQDRELDEYLRQPQHTQEQKRKFAAWKKASEEAAQRRQQQEKDLEEKVESIRKIVQVKLQQLRKIHQQRIQKEGDHKNEFLVVVVPKKRDEYVDDLMHYRGDNHVVNEVNGEPKPNTTNLKKKINEDSASERIRQKSQSKVLFVN